MRTLFLMAILFFLVVLAVKEPDQSAWDAARDIGSQVEGAVSEIEEDPVVREMKGNAREALAELESDDLFFQQVREALGTATDPAPSTHGIEKSTGPDDAWIPELPPKSETKPAPVKRAVSPHPSVAKVKPETPPGLPAIPMAPFEVGNLGGKTLPRRPAPVAASDRDYAEIKEYYENASRLLAEME